MRTPTKWKPRSFAEIVSFRNGMNFTQASKGAAVKVIGVGDFKDKEVLSDFSKTERIVLNGDINDDDLLKDNDLLFVRSNGSKALIGRCVLLKNVSEPISFSGFTIRARICRTDIDPSYLSELVRSPLFKQHLHRFGGGSSISNLSQDAMAQFTFSLPPLPEQRKIADVLQTWDRAVESTAQLQRVKQTQFDAYLMRFFQACHPSVKERAGNWRKFVMGDLFKERTQQGLAADVLLSITRSEGVIYQDGVGRRDSSNEDKSNYKLVLPGDIAYNTMRMWQGVSGLSSLRGIVSPAYTVLIPDPNVISPRYAAHLFKSRRMIHDFERYSQGLTSDTWNLKYPVFTHIGLYMPPIAAQDQQARLLDAMKDEMRVIGRQVELLVAQKRGLMQKLLTGEWRVPC